MNGLNNPLWLPPRGQLLINEFKGWPPIVNSGDLSALNLWWDYVGTPSLFSFVLDGGSEDWTESYLKVTADATGEGLYQGWVFADEPRMKSGKTMSALIGVMAVTGRTITVGYYNSDGTKTEKTVSGSTGVWQVVAVEDHVISGAYCHFRVTLDAAGDLYVVPLGACIGPRAMWLPPRPTRIVECTNDAPDIFNMDAGGVWTDIDISAITSPLAFLAQGIAQYLNNTQGGASLNMRRKGDTRSAWGAIMVPGYIASQNYMGEFTISLDDGQVFQIKGAGVADSEAITVSVRRYWEFA